MAHIVLLGDSIFDNAAYVAGGPDVIHQLRARLPNDWQATLGARDGAVTGSITSQLASLPTGATHLVVSIGGNDALSHISVLEDTANSIATALNRLANIIDGFKRDYSGMLDAVSRLRLPTAICTIYEPRFPDPRLQRLGVTALSLFNDCITREAFARGLPLLDLRLICDHDEDYANPIEPSVKGGEKIAAAIVRAVAESDFSKARTEVFAKGERRPPLCDARLISGACARVSPCPVCPWLSAPQARTGCACTSRRSAAKARGILGCCRLPDRGLAAFRRSRGTPRPA